MKYVLQKVETHNPFRSFEDINPGNLFKGPSGKLYYKIGRRSVLTLNTDETCGDVVAFSDGNGINYVDFGPHKLTFNPQV